MGEGGEWIRSRGGSLEGGGEREDRRLWQQVSPPWKAAIFRFVRAFRKTFAFLPGEEERKASLALFLLSPPPSSPLHSSSFPLRASRPSFSRTHSFSPSLSFVFFSLLSSSFSLARSLHSSLSFSLCPLGSAWMNEKRIRFCVLRETGFFPTLNYKTALQLFFPGARYFSFFRSL